jgi:hypothetical protein
MIVQASIVGTGCRLTDPVALDGIEAVSAFGRQRGSSARRTTRRGPRSKEWVHEAHTRRRHSLWRA